MLGLMPNVVPEKMWNVAALPAQSAAQVRKQRAASSPAPLRRSRYEIRLRLGMPPATDPPESSTTEAAMFPESWFRPECVSLKPLEKTRTVSWPSLLRTWGIAKFHTPRRGSAFFIATLVGPWFQAPFHRPWRTRQTFP